MNHLFCVMHQRMDALVKEKSMKNEYCFKSDSDSVKNFKLQKSAVSNRMMRGTDHV